MTTIAREYLRVSKDKSGRKRSNTEQHGDHEYLADEHAWTLHPTPYEDAVSASRYGKKHRDGFADLMADLNGHTFGADILLLWESSRGSRQVGEWVNLIELLAKRGIKVYVFTDDRLFDPRRPTDRRDLLRAAVDAEHSSGETSMRLRRAHAADAKAGHVHGVVPYGYRRLYKLDDNGKRIIVGQVPKDGEAEVVLDVYERIAAGQALARIARELNQQGVRPRPSNRPDRDGNVDTNPVWNAHRIRRLAMVPAVAGKRIHLPGTYGQSQKRRLLAKTATLYDAEWPAIVPFDLWQRVQTILNDPSRLIVSPGRSKNLLTRSSGVVCATCGATLGASHARRANGRVRIYQCDSETRTCVVVKADDLDEFAEDLIVTYVADEANSDVLTPPTDDVEVSQLEIELAQAEREYEDVLASFKAKRMSLRAFEACEPDMVAEIERRKVQLNALRTPEPLRAFAESGEPARQVWEDMSIEAQREVVRFVFKPDRVGTLAVLKSPRKAGRRGTPIVERVELRRVDGAHRLA